MLSNSIPHKMLDLVNRELEIGESIVWSGTPRRAFFTPSSIAAFLFGIPWTGFAIFWTIAAGAGTILTSGFSFFSFFPLFGVPFILIGFAMLSTPLATYLKSGRTVYVITDRRAITFEGGRHTVIRSYTPDKLGEIYRTEKPNGYGDVIIVHKSWRDSDGDRQSEELGFQRVPNAKEVERLLKALAGKARRIPPRNESIYGIEA